MTTSHIKKLISQFIIILLTYIMIFERCFTPEKDLLEVDDLLYDTISRNIFVVSCSFCECDVKMCIFKERIDPNDHFHQMTDWDTENYLRMINGMERIESPLAFDAHYVFTKTVLF